MKNLVNAARHHVVDCFTCIVMPWALMTFVFAVNLVTAAVVSTSPKQEVPMGGLASSASV